MEKVDVTVLSVEILDTVSDVFDIQVETDESFIVAGVVVHNSAVCRARDGLVFPVDKGPRPPAHYSCRSTTSPVVKSWKELGINLKQAPEGTRSSMNGQVPASTTYNDWLKKQPVSFQDDVLGKTKGKLFRKGGLTQDKFIDRAGEEYTLAELKTRESAAWEKTFGDE